MATSLWPAWSSACRMAVDLPVHHPAGRHDVRPGVGLGHRGPGVEHDGGVVVDLAGGGQHAAVAVVGVLVEAAVGHDDDLVADARCACPAARAGRCRRGSRPPSPRGPSGLGTPKRMTAGTPSAASSCTSLRRLSRVCWTTLGQRGDGLRLVDALPHEQRGDEVVRRSRVSATRRRIAADEPQPAGALVGDRSRRPMLLAGLSRRASSAANVTSASDVTTRSRSRRCRAPA